MSTYSLVVASLSEVGVDNFVILLLLRFKLGIFRYFYLFATQLHYLNMSKEKKKKKCRKRWRGGLKETIELMLIRPPQLQFFEDGIKITATGTV